MIIKAIDTGFDCLPYRRRRQKGSHIECLFGYLIKRSGKENLETTYDCKFKFDVHWTRDALGYPMYQQNAPSDSGDAAIRILLTVNLQWEMFHENDSVKVYNGSNFRSFFVSSKICLAEVEGRLKGIISPILSSLGLVFAEQNRPVTNQLMRNVTFLYSKTKARGLNQLPNSWVPITLDIAVQIIAPEGHVESVFFWPDKEAKRFLLGLELVMRTDTDYNEELFSCFVCQEQGPPGCEYVRLPDCSHIYHEKCIMQRLAIKRICPLCRIPLCTYKRHQWRTSNPKEPKNQKVHSGSAVDGLQIVKPDDAAAVCSEFLTETRF